MKHLKNIKLVYFTDFLLFLIVFPCSLIFKIYLKLKKRNIWMISEEINGASDNGFALFKYIRTNYPNREVYYVIEKNCKEESKVLPYKNIIAYRSIKHWMYYLSSKIIITTHKHSTPSKSVFYILQKLGWGKNRRIFLQHGITMSNVKYLHYKQTKYRLFICAAQSEYEYVKNEFGYPEDNVKLLGFSRFDELANNQLKRQILLMPSWRKWLVNIKNFNETEYYKRWQSLINNSELINKIEKNNVNMYFFIHGSLQKYKKLFTTTSKNVKIVSIDDIDLTDLIKESKSLVTDYSSVSFDFSYINKPIFYYQFDLREFRANHLEEGYFSYQKDGFGPIITNEKSLVEKIINNIDLNFINNSKYEKRINNFFTLKDNQNSKRIYNYLDKIEMENNK